MSNYTCHHSESESPKTSSFLPLEDRPAVNVFAFCATCDAKIESKPNGFRGNDIFKGPPVSLLLRLIYTEVFDGFKIESFSLVLQPTLLSA